MPDIMANGIKIHYERTGGNKPPLLLLHGISDTGACWPRVVAALKGDRDLIMLDARGHGLSEAPASGYTWQVLADDVAAFVEALGLKKPGLMGHSMGALTAAIVGAHYPDLPGYLILEDPPMRDPMPGETAQAHRQQADEMRKSLMARKAMGLDEMINYRANEDPGILSWDKVEYAPWSEAKYRTDSRVYELVEHGITGYRDIFPHITCPTLIIAADPAKQPAAQPEAAAYVAKTNPHVKLVTIYGAGHNIRREQFDTYINTVKAFLDSLPA